jgi:cob(I)alamin adenosyltransferase
MHDRISSEQSGEPISQARLESRRQVEELLAAESNLRAEWSELQKQLSNTHEELFALLCEPATEDSKERASKLQERLEEIHDQQHEIATRQASIEQTTIRQWYTTDQNDSENRADSIADTSR